MEAIYVNYINILQSIVPLEQWEIDEIIKSISVKSVCKNTIFKHAGSVVKELYFVSNGCVRTYYLDKNNKECTRSIAFENMYCWAINFLNNLPIHEYIEAIVDSELLVFKKEAFNQLVEKSPGFKKVYLISLEKIALTYASRVESLISMDAKERYHNLLLNSPDMVLTISNKIVASYLGITEQSLSRIKSYT
ncbi:MAG: Crp/Fnr family transcriptional regulator [Bacteroidota bacterium]